MKFRYINVSIFAIACIFIFSNVNARADGYIEKELRASNGLSIQGIDIGGDNKKEIKSKIADYQKELQNSDIKLIADTKEKVLSLGDIGVKIDSKDVISRAMIMGNRGNIAQQMEERAKLSNGSDDSNLSLKLAVNEDELKKNLNAMADTLDSKPVNASLKRVNGSFQFIEGEKGEVINVPTSISKIIDSIENNDFDPENSKAIKLDTKIIEPKGNYEELSKVKDLLGSASTNYVNVASRTKNLITGMNKIDGKIVYPGEVFSVYNNVSPFTADNGYSLGGAYQNGKVVMEYGGGICQVSSTLYNAVLAAELEVVERAQHSMLVGYLPPAQDAAIAGTYKDLKFKNNTKYPIYIETIIGGGRMTTNIYGHEYRPKGRIVKYESEVTSTTIPKTKYVKVNKEIGYENVVSSAHVGKTAKLWKIVTYNGKTEKTLVSNNSYAAAPKVVEIGIKTPKGIDIKALNEAIKKGEPNIVNSAINSIKSNIKKHEKNSEKKSESNQDTDDDISDPNEDDF